MSQLSDGTIARMLQSGELVITPWDDAMLQPSSVDLHLGDSWATRNGTKFTNTEVFLPFGIPMLGTTKERIKLPNHIAAELTGTSTAARLHVSCHQQAGHVDPGFEGELTFELSTTDRSGIWLEAGMRIAQLVFYTLDAPAIRPYGDRGRYQGQTGATPARGTL